MLVYLAPDIYTAEYILIEVGRPLELLNLSALRPLLDVANGPAERGRLVL